MSKITNVMFLVLVFFLSSCASLHSVSVTDIPKKRSNQVEANADKLIILGLNFSNDYVDQLSADLAAQCQGGMVSGILTKHESYFYFLAAKVKVRASGYCVQGTKGDMNNNENRKKNKNRKKKRT